MKSKWEPGTRVRVKDGVELAGEVGVIKGAEYAKQFEETSVLLDRYPGLPAWFRDDELEAE